jgi:hypothetical protein
MNFLHKKLWIAWSKLRFLRLPVERRVRLEVTTDGRHITFLLVSLHEAGYGVQVVGSPAVFRELICLKESAPIPFVIGGEERECGISITDKSGFNHGEHGGGKRVLLDYDYFSGLNNARASHGGTSPTRSANGPAEEALRAEMQRSGNIEPRMTRIYTDGQQGDAQGTCAGAAFSNPSTSELARASGNTSLTRSASDPASSAEQPRTDIGGLISDKSEVAKALESGRSTLDSDRRPNAGHSLKEWSGVFEELSPSSLGSMPSKTPPAWAPGVPALASSSVLIREIRGQKSGNIDFPPQALRAPYFMHPSVYHRGLHKRRAPRTALDSAAKQRRRFRIGFFGTHDREFYTNHYHFQGMNRFEILEVFLQKYGSRMTHLRGFPRDWDPCEIAVSIDARGGDRSGKAFLSQEHYFEALHECDFVLSPPGWCMPVSHNLIEAVFCGAIPITNGGAFMAEPLADDVNCLAFKNVEELAAAVERALAMDVGEVERMRWAVLDYYERVLEPNAFGEKLLRSESARVLVNAEENSVPLVFAGMVFPWDVPADTMQT